MLARSGTQLRVDVESGKLPDRASAQIISIVDLYQEADRQAAGQFSKLCANGQWQDAIELVVRVVGVTEAELASRLAVSRSTVNRWLTVGSRPLRSAMPYIEDGIRNLILARHDQHPAA